MNLQPVVTEWKKRPWWMNLMWFFCIYMTFVYMPFDMFIKDVAVDAEVWFGFTLRGWWAKATEPLHWLIYGFGAYGFWKMRRWMHPWAALYVAQIAIAMAVFNLLNAGVRGLVPASISFVIFLVPTIALWMSKERFSTSKAVDISKPVTNGHDEQSMQEPSTKD